MSSYDVIIIGGGMVGASLACALGGQDLRVAVVEARPPGMHAEPGYDERAIALAYGTQRIFTGLGLWSELEDVATPIHRIHVSDRGHFGMTRMDRSEEGLPALGYVVPARNIGQVLERALGNRAGIDYYAPARVTTLCQTESAVHVEINCDGETTGLDTRLLVAADGVNSAVREHFGIETTETDYAQTAIVTNITPQLSHDNIAYERFTDSGPLALLPMTQQRCAVVWTVASEQADAVMALDDDTFIEQMQSRFGNRLGRLRRPGLRQAWPLKLLQANESVRERLALVGNAAHTLHPVAGQGFNLGARDIAVLAEVLVDATSNGEDPGSMHVLERYAAWRDADHQSVRVFTDGLARLFTLPMPALGLARSAGMLALDLLPPAKRLLTRMTMGRGGKPPRLSRGLPL